MPEEDKRVTTIGLAVAAGLTGLVVVLAGYGLLAWVSPTEIALSAGWNEVTYTGKRQIAGVAMQSIWDYVEIAYYYDPFQESWVEILFDTELEPGMLISIKVTEACIWIF